MRATYFAIGVFALGLTFWAGMHFGELRMVCALFHGSSSLRILPYCLGWR